MLKKEYERLTIAEKLSLLMRDPELPGPIGDAIKDANNDIYNDLGWRLQYELESSPQYLDILIRGSKLQKEVDEVYTNQPIKDDSRKIARLTALKREYLRLQELQEPLIEEAMAITGEKAKNGHTWDFLTNNPEKSAEQMLSDMVHNPSDSWEELSL